MNIYLLFLLGVAFGSIATIVIMEVTSAHGYFKVEPVEPDEGTYSVNISVSKGYNLMKKKHIILHRDPNCSQK